MGYDESVVIVSSVDLEWSRPSYTGSRGVSMNYTVSANGGTVVVSDDSEVVRYTSQSLIYGDVLVSAINSCGQESIRPALLNIPASGIATSCMVFSFDMSIQNHLNWSNRVWRYTTIMLLRLCA